MRLSIVRRALDLVFFHNESAWPSTMKDLISRSCFVIPNFITEKEEQSLLAEIEPHMKRLRYEKSHWDDAIHLYREREQRSWSKENETIIQRVRDISFKKGDAHLSYVHILDLHKDGVIKAHIDSTRYCGDVISGMCLLSDAVLRLRHKDRKDELIMDLLVPRRCLYRMGYVSSTRAVVLKSGDIASTLYCGDVISGMCLLSDAVLRLRHKDRKDELIMDLLVPRRCLYRMGYVSSTRAVVLKSGDIASTLVTPAFVLR
ncbi:Alpha-ketoglutarate-dependent dioxygenase alkB -like protein 7, mitochondrial [Toxocara canis]|uniref:Alpha-ketoglutarate-dependent dioxygenase alkB-like protein 7, mitochondrial n=1 Tax=Toxocara canis TaxID=6265 RepID=A0A0B2UUR7_TOXCA|nr:Alpha-ketoglutarate-dependent dioxygenase alkB -like protein 7, mitochondrial [Toxocara canis]